MALSAPFATAASRAGSTVRSIGRTAIFYVVIGLMGLVGVGFLVAALYIWLAATTDVLIAALIMAAGFLGVAGITLAVVMAKAERRKQERKRAAANTAMIASSMALANTGLRLASRVKGPLLWPALGILAATLYFGRRNGDD